MILQNLIFPFDYILISISLLFILFSFWKGFIHSLLSLLTWVGSIIITIYSYNSLSEFLYNQLININIFNDYKEITNMISFIISIPLIFLFSLFLLRKIRKIISNDLDKQILGLIFDKFFGLIYGAMFSYIVFSTILYGINHFEYFESFSAWIIDNSYIFKSINNFNSNIISYLSLYEENTY